MKFTIDTTGVSDRRFKHPQVVVAVVLETNTTFFFLISEPLTVSAIRAFVAYLLAMTTEGFTNLQLKTGSSELRKAKRNKFSVGRGVLL
jgi:hypothetical protein